MTGGKIDFRPESGCRFYKCVGCFFPLVCFSRKTHQQPSAPRKLILGSIKSGPASGLFFKFSCACGGLCFSKFVGACGGLCCFFNFPAPAAGLFFFKIFRRLRRALFFQKKNRRLRRALFFQNCSAPAAGVVFSKIVGACGGLCLFNCFGARGGPLFLFR